MKDSSLYHYTDIGAVASIIKNKKLWLTHVGFLNDSQELHDGVGQMKECLNKMKGDKWEPRELKAFEAVERILSKHFDTGYEEKPLFTCSFSRAENLLSQWRAYGGFAVEFDRSKIAIRHDVYECVYDREEKILEARYLIEKIHGKLVNYLELDDEGFVSDAVSDCFDLILGVSKFKNHNFSEEREVRIVHGFVKNDVEVKHRARGDYLVPYIELGFDVDALKAVHVGPVANQELAEKSLRSLLMAAGVSHLPVVRSDIPFRS